ncbi:MAG TPA: beta-ketoacyl-ACP synthase III [Hyphomicrobiales bacterium]|nr:beta-ketoacyl-ACP synthase III [Hyphomicrobiales bacterium]
MTMIRSVVRGCGAYLPERVVTNEELALRVDTSDAWIQQRTGIRERRIAADGETTADIGTAAALAALEDARLEPADIDLIILATATPDNTFPATSTTIQSRLGMHHGAAFDIHAVCSGFIFALAAADNFLRCGQFRRALVIGAETFSRIMDWDDRTTCVLFGDGGGAVVLETEEQTGTNADRGVLMTKLRSDGRYKEMLYVDGGPSTTQTVGHLRMHGREVFRGAVTLLSEVVEDALKSAGLSASQIDWFVPHQANKRIIDAMARKLNVPEERVVTTIDRHANTSAASIPLALRAAVEEQKIHRGQLVLMEAMGGGFTWGAALVRW